MTLADHAFGARRGDEGDVEHIQEARHHARVRSYAGAEHQERTLRLRQLSANHVDDFLPRRRGNGRRLGQELGHTGAGRRAMNGDDQERRARALRIGGRTQRRQRVGSR